LRFVRLQQVSQVQMHMRPYLFAVFDVPVHTQYFERKELLRYRPYLLDTGLFPRFPARKSVSPSM
jgi:CRISPR/Cas system-associated protein endoribonuclease Cas2